MDLIEQGFSPDDEVQEWGIESAVNGLEVDEYAITADTTDERLDEIEADILASLTECGAGGPAVSHDLGVYLRERRDELQHDAADSQ